MAMLFILFQLEGTAADIHKKYTELLQFISTQGAALGVPKALLWPVLYVIKWARLLSVNSYLAFTQLINTGLPNTRDWFVLRVVTSAPNSTYCFNKTGFLIFFIDLYFMLFSLYFIFPRRVYTYLYLVAKFISIALPFIVISPMARLPFWVIGFVLTLFECFIGLYLIFSWGYGVDWENANFYGHWKKHYHYRAPTGNRKLAIELAVYAYLICKSLTLFDFFCRREQAFGPRPARTYDEYAHAMAPVVAKPTLYPWHIPALLSTPAAVIASYIVTITAVLLIITWVAYIRIGTGPERRMRDRIKRRLERKKLWMARKATQAVEPFAMAMIYVATFTLASITVFTYRDAIWDPVPVVELGYASLVHNERALQVVDSIMKSTDGGAQIPRGELRFAMVQMGKHVMWSLYTARYVMSSSPRPVSASYQMLHDVSVATAAERRNVYEVQAALEAESRGENRPCNIGPDLSYIEALLEQDSVSNLRYGVLFLLALSSLGVYSIILAGWSSNSKYAFIGALRSAAQMISYEVAISLIILPIVVLAGSLNLTMITYVQTITIWFLWPLLPISLVFLIAMLAETNRTPFDLPEAEAELVAGYNVDYSSLPFAMFFLGEYCNMILISVLFCLLFLGGGLNVLGLHSAALLAVKAAVIWIFFVIIRATLPRYRYDQLMDIGWKVFLPISGGFLVFVFGILVYFDGLPVTSELPLMTHVLFTDAAAFLFVIQSRTVSVGAWP